MRDIVVNLTCDIPETFLTIKAANSVDLNIKEKATHTKQFNNIDIDSSFNIGLILGNSGSGKTTLAKAIYREKFKEQSLINLSLPIIEQFPEEFDYECIQKVLNSVGLTHTVCWVKPAFTLSNGQRFRAEVALKCCHNINSDEEIIIDEWTSVVDRTVAKMMSHSIQKFARKFNKKIVLLSCHYDITEWISPDWILDCNDDIFENRRELRPVRKEKIKFDVRKVDRKTWPRFSQYHYLSKALPGGKSYFFGLFLENTQIGFICFSNYVSGRTNTLHFNRTVIHPDYCGFGLGIKLINACSKIMYEKGFIVYGKFSSVSVYKSMVADYRWKLINNNFKTSNFSFNIDRNKSVRQNVKWWSFKYICEKS